MKNEDDDNRLVADRLKEKFENFFDSPPASYYETDSSVAGKLFFKYKIGECNFEKFRDLLLEYKPSQGFGKLITPTLIAKDNVEICFSLQRENDKTGILKWGISVSIKTSDYFKVSLREMIGYSEPIQASFEARISELYIEIWVRDDYKAVFLETIPSEWDTNSSKYAGYKIQATLYTFVKDITGSAVEDVLFHFKTVKRYNPYQAAIGWLIAITIAFWLGVVTVVILGIAYLVKNWIFGKERDTGKKKLTRAFLG